VGQEKVFDRVPRGVTRRALRKLGVEEWLVSTLMAMYEGVETVVRTVEGVGESFPVKVGLHQGSVLSPLLFIIVIDALTRKLKGLPWELLYAVDLVLVATSERELKEQKWKISLESEGLKINAGKPKVMVGGEGSGKV
jgi:hypothetical protein